MSVIVNVTTTLSEDLLAEFLQHIRNFEARYSSSVEMAIAVDAPEMSVSQVETIMRNIRPAFPFMNVIRKD